MHSSTTLPSGNHIAHPADEHEEARLTPPKNTHKKTDAHPQKTHASHSTPMRKYVSMMKKYNGKRGATCIINIFLTTRPWEKLVNTRTSMRSQKAEPFALGYQWFFDSTIRWTNCFVSRGNGYGSSTPRPLLSIWNRRCSASSNPFALHTSYAKSP